jgi:hypothetical protein
MTPALKTYIESWLDKVGHDLCQERLCFMIRVKERIWAWLKRSPRRSSDWDVRILLSLGIQSGQL